MRTEAELLANGEQLKVKQAEVLREAIAANTRAHAFLEGARLLQAAAVEAAANATRLNAEVQSLTLDLREVIRELAAMKGLPNPLGAEGELIEV